MHDVQYFMKMIEFRMYIMSPHQIHTLSIFNVLVKPSTAADKWSWIRSIVDVVTKNHLCEYSRAVNNTLYMQIYRSFPVELNNFIWLNEIMVNRIAYINFILKIWKIRLATHVPFVRVENGEEIPSKRTLYVNMHKSFSLQMSAWLFNAKWQMK